jgi:serine/threonine-protein kinase RsbW
MEKVTLPAKLENLDLMMGLILKSAESVGFDEKGKFQIRLASEEILVNIINHAYPDKPGAIELILTPRQKEGLEMVFADWGMAFDPLSLPMPNVCAPVEERKIGGLGVYLLRKVMDEVKYKRENGRNILTVVKKLKRNADG